MTNEISFCGRRISSTDIELVRQLTLDFPALTLHELANTVAELLDWRRPTGKLKTRECVSLLERLAETDQLPGLPALRKTSPRGPRSVPLDNSSNPQDVISDDLHHHLPLQFQLIQTQAERALFRQYMERYHYLGYRIPYGAQLRYFVCSAAAGCPLLACLLFASAAWKMAPRDRWIGWSGSVRQVNLCRVVNQSRFLILPWVRMDNLASHLLSRVVTTLGHDWHAYYQVQPLLLETLVDISRFDGSCYRAANWIDLGLTQGRGRMDRYRQAVPASKRIFVHPLCRNVRQLLCRPKLQEN